MTRCTYWDEVEFLAADRKFDGGEFSSDVEPNNEPCGTCESCKQADEFWKTHAADEGPYGRNV